MGNVKDTAQIVKGIAEAVPVYEDALQPAMKELGKGIHTLSKLVNIALTPASLLVWGYDQIKNYLETSLQKKLEDRVPENIIPPDPSIAVPAIEALRYMGQKEDLREIFTHLLANSMDKTTKSQAHPSFVEVIKQLSSEEAKILNSIDPNNSYPVIRVRGYEKENTDFFAEPLVNFSTIPYVANCDYPELGPSYLENIARLGIAEISYQVYTIKENSYEPLESHPEVSYFKELLSNNDKRVEIIKGAFTPNSYGKKFYKACIS